MLALWEYTWDESAWSSTTDEFFGLLAGLRWAGTSAPAPGPSPSPQPLAPPSPTDSGHKKRRYQRANSDFWDTRERYLRRFVEPIAAPLVASIPAPEPTPAPNSDAKVTSTAPVPGRELLLLQAVQAARARAQTAQNPAELMAMGQKISQMAIDIQKLRKQNYARAAQFLLLDVL